MCFVLSGVYLSLRGETIPNDGYVLAIDVGIENTGLLCNTDRSDCCRASDNPNGISQGQWYYPDGREVRTFTEEDTAGHPRNFFYRNRATGIVRLNHIGAPPERGHFHCEVPNAAGDMVTLYVNIGEWFVSTIWVLIFYALMGWPF